MPYIKPEQRTIIDSGLEVIDEGINDPGELNYALTRIAMRYLEREGLRYKNIAMISGVLKNVYDEFYRRVVVPYEKLKSRENGDVLEYELLTNDLED